MSPPEARSTSRNVRKPESVSAARVAAARALMAVEAEPNQGGAPHLEDALAALVPGGAPAGEAGGATPGSDRDLAWFLAYGVCRKRGEVDAALRGHLTRPIASLDPAVRAALRVGAFERLFARTPPHAVVHQAVEVVRALGAGRAHGMVNAVMRRVEPARDISRVERLDHPAWLVARWDERYGVEEVERWCADNGEVPPMFLVGAPGAAPPEDGAPVTVSGRSLPDVWRVPSGDPTRRADFERFWVQDAAAVAVADFVGAKEGEKVLDACAAPGGKSLRMASRGARVVAADRDRARIDRIREAAKRVGFTDRIETRLVDWLKSDASDWGNFDAVLVDAPCSGLGTVRRHPEIRWRRTEADLARAATQQRAILGSAAKRVRSGGRLVYAVCSPEPEEGEQVVAAFLAEHPDFRADGSFVTAPPRDGEDAHFAARMLRR